MITEIMPNIRQFKYTQDKTDWDYGTCLWAVFTLDCDRYTLFIDSDCGNYVYGWSVTPSESFPALMARINGEYLLGKIAEESEFNYLKSVIETCGNLIDYYGFDKGEITAFDELISEINDLSECRNDANMFYRDCGEAIIRYDSDIMDLYELISISRDYPAGAKRIAKLFIDHLQPLLKKGATKNEATGL